MDLIYRLSVAEKCIGLSSFAAMCAGTVLAHEYSHMAAMRALYTDIHPSVGCNFDRLWKGDIVNFLCYVNPNGTPKVRPGLSLNYKTADGIVKAAGPLSDFLLIALSSVVALKLKHSHKKTAALFALHAFAVNFQGFTYALLTQGSRFGDFAAIESRLGFPHHLQTAILGSSLVGIAILVNHVFSV